MVNEFPLIRPRDLFLMPRELHGLCHRKSVTPLSSSSSGRAYLDAERIYFCLCLLCQMRVLGSLHLVANSEVVVRAPESFPYLLAGSETPGNRYDEEAQAPVALFVQARI